MIDWLKKIMQRLIGGKQQPPQQPTAEEFSSIKEEEIVRIANIQISIFKWNWRLEEERKFVMFVVKPTNFFCPPPFSLFFQLPVYDYRPEVVEAAKALRAINPDYDAFLEDRRRAREALSNAVRQPAKVVVTHRSDENFASDELNLYSSEEEEPTASLSIRKERDVELDDHNLWNFCLGSKDSKTGEVVETVLAVLTDIDHKAVINEDPAMAAVLN